MTDGAVRAVPVAVRGGHHFADLAVGRGHSCGLDVQGRVWCWGSNGFEQLMGGASFEDDDLWSTSKPRAVPIPVPLTKISSGADHTCGLDDQGHAWCWGDGSAGQLGQDDWDLTGPAQVPGTQQFVAIAAGRYQTCAIDLAGLSWCWGSDTEEALGLGEPSAVFDGRPEQLDAALFVG